MGNEQKQVVKYFTETGCIARLFCLKDDVYDQMVLTTLNGLNLKQKALGKIGLDEDQLKEIPPIFFHGFYYKDKPYTRVGKDGNLRSSKYDATWLFFSSTQVYMYKYILDMASEWKKEATEEYFYKDITNFSTVTESVDVAGKSREVNEFALVVPGDKFYCSISGVQDADRAISAMKQKLREKKG